MNTSVAIRRKRLQEAKARKAERSELLTLCSQVVMMVLCLPIVVALSNSEFNVVQNFSFVNMLICALPVTTFVLVFKSMMDNISR